MTITGECTCGAIRLTIPPPSKGSLGICHCTSCRKATGALASYNLGVKKEDMSVNGETGTFVEIGSSGGEVVRYFCKVCGSPIFNHDQLEPEMRWVSAGLFPPRSLPVPDRHIFAKNMEEWEVPISGASVKEDQ